MPIKTIFDIHHNSGAIAMDISPDSKYLVTLGADSPQNLCVWDWSSEENEPMISCSFELGNQVNWQFILEVGAV
jgi:hypothetical protein